MLPLVLTLAMLVPQPTMAAHLHLVDGLGPPPDLAPKVREFLKKYA